jgi:SnoaL-like domain
VHGDPSGTTVATRLLAAIRARDQVEVEACFAPAARLRVLTPKSLREEDGPAAIGRRYDAWLGALEDYRLLAADAEWVADRVRIRYRFLGRDPEKGWQENEHTAYAEVVDGLIVALNVSCAGFRPSGDR